MEVNAKSVLLALGKSHPILFGLYVVLTVVLSMQFIVVPILVRRALAGFLLRDGRHVRHILGLVLFGVFFEFICTLDGYIATECQRLLGDGIIEQSVKFILQPDSAAGTDDNDRGVWMSSVCEFSSELWNFVSTTRRFYIVPSIYMLGSSVVLWGRSDWTIRALFFLQSVIAVSTPVIAIWSNGKKFDRSEQLKAVKFDYLDDVFQNTRTVMSFDASARTIAQLKENAANYSKETMTISATVVCTIMIPMALLLAGLLVCILLRVYRHSKQSVNLPELAELLMAVMNRTRYFGVMMQSSLALMLSYSVLSTMSTRMASVLPVVAINRPELVQSEHRLEEGLHFHGVSFSYPNKTEPVLKNISLQFPNCSRTVLAAPSGTGKSTVLNLIKGFLVPTEGYITLNGVPLNRTHRVGFVFQQAQLFRTTVWENIGYGSPALSKPEIEALLCARGLNDILTSMGLELDQQVGKGGGCLSGGQKQVVQLLRVLITDPDVLLLDEPSAALDDVNREIVMGLILQSMEARIIILVTHDQELLKHAHRVIYLGSLD